MKSPKFVLAAGFLWVIFASVSYSTPYCQETTTIYELDTITPLGFSGRDLLGSTYTGDIQVEYNYKDETINGFIGVLWAPDISARYISSEAVYPPCIEDRGCQDIGIICQDRVELYVDIFLHSDDGGFSENWSATISSSNYGTSAIGLKPSEIKGTFYRDANSPAPEWHFTGSFTPTGFSGEIFGWLSDCEDDDEMCSTTRVSGATFRENR